MRAVWYDRQGAADEVLVCGELTTPEAGYGEVRVRLEPPASTPRTRIGGIARQRWSIRAS